MAKRRPRIHPGGRETVDFGYRRVEAAEKAVLVRDVFDRVAPAYDLMNDLMSGGLHRLWKRLLVDRLSPAPGMRLLDVAGGTGDVAFRLLERVRGGKGGGRVVVVDATEAMLGVGRRRAAERGFLAGIDWVCGDAERLPVPDRAFDGYTIAFGLRNVTRIDEALAEAHRAIRPGGRFLCLEFSRVVLPLLDRLYDEYSLRVVPLLGGIVAGDADAYRYLAESIRRFPEQERLAERIRRAGFDCVSYQNLTGGIVAIHSAWRT